MPASRAATALLGAVLLVGVAGCGGGGGDGASKKDPSSQPSASASPTVTPSAPAVPVPGASGAAPGAAVLPSDFPTAQVPLAQGQLTTSIGGPSPSGTPGRQGWVLELTSSASPDACFAEAAAKLVGAGFTKQGEFTSGTNHQAQFTTSEYAVIISSSPAAAGCQLGYEVGQVSK